MKNINYNDPRVWALYHEGKTKGIFQLESNLGKSWSKRLKPNNLEELSDLTSLIRPGCIHAVLDGKTMAQHYVDRKHGLDKVSYLHESLEEILHTTYGVIVYQEQSMKIAVKLAGFNLQEADDLRKAIGKKKADLMAKVKVKFLAGCTKTKVVSDEIAQAIWGQIEKSARYAFNKSHGIAYAMDSYWTAWEKFNRPKKFFTSYLTHAGDQQEIYELVSEAKLFDIEVKIPNINQFSETFKLRKDGKIYFGLKDIKSMADKTGDKVMDAIKRVEEQLGKKAAEFTWMDILVGLSPKIVSTAFKALCSIGFFSNAVTGINRSKALYEFLIFDQLTTSELKWVESHYGVAKWKTLKDCLIALAPTKKEGGGTSKADRSDRIRNEVMLIDKPPYSLDDEPTWIVEQENKFLGCPISISRIETSDTSAANTTCKEILDGKKGEGLCIAGNLVRVANYKVKRGKSAGELMAFLTIEDETCTLESISVFPKVKKSYDHLLYEGANVLLCGKTDKDSFIVEKIHEI